MIITVLQYSIFYKIVNTIWETRIIFSLKVLKYKKNLYYYLWVKKTIVTQTDTQKKLSNILGINVTCNVHIFKQIRYYMLHIMFNGF